MSSRINYGGNFSVMDTSEEYLIMDWLKCVIDEFKEEESNVEWPIKLLDRESRKAVWYLAELFNSKAHSYGTGGQACRIFERYVAIKCKSFVNILLNNEHDDVANQWNIFKSNFLKKIILHVVSSIQLASKMSHSGVQFSIKSVHNKLLNIGIQFSQAEIRESEFEVFKTLGFRLPMWSSLETAELFAKKVKFNCDQLYVVVNFVEIFRIDIDEHVRELVKVDSFSGTPVLRTLHLSAACVVVCARVMAQDENAIIEQLTTLIGAPPLFIKCIADIIIKMVGDNAKNETDSDTSDKLDKGELTDSGDDDKPDEMDNNDGEGEETDDNSVDDDKAGDIEDESSDDQYKGHNSDDNDREEQTDDNSDSGSDQD